MINKDCIPLWTVFNCDLSLARTTLRLHWGGLHFFNRCPCVEKVCSIRSRWMIISSRRGSRYDLVMFTVGSIAWSLFSISRLHDDWHCSRTWVLISGGSQSKVRSNCWLAGVRLLLQQCRLPSYRPGLRDYLGTHIKKVLRQQVTFHVCNMKPQQ